MVANFARRIVVCPLLILFIAIGEKWDYAIVVYSFVGFSDGSGANFYPFRKTRVNNNNFLLRENPIELKKFYPFLKTDGAYFGFNPKSFVLAGILLVC